MLDAEEGKKDQEEFVSTYCCYFEVQYSIHICSHKEFIVASYMEHTHIIIKFC